VVFVKLLNSIVIPGELAMASADPESRKIECFWMPAFASMTERSPTSFAKFGLYLQIAVFARA
jgi:hypothetical protein